MTIYFTNDDIWIGGPHQLSIELGAPDNQRAFTALQKLWTYPSLKGCYLEADKEPDQQKRVVPNIAHVETEAHLYGLTWLPVIQDYVACYSYFVREDEGSDWLVLCIPRGALSPYFNTQTDPAWEQPIDQLFVEIGKYVFTAIDYQLALAGFHTSGQAYASELSIKGIPERRWFGYLWPQDGKLNYFPRNEP